MDDQTIEELRRPAKEKVTLKKSFMSHGEMKHIRTDLLHVTQRRLCAALIDPSDGEPIQGPMYSYWESGKRSIPLWAARRMRDLAEAAKSYDRREDT
jgi:hypothetical protein